MTSSLALDQDRGHNTFRNTIKVSNGLDPDQDQGPLGHKNMYHNHLKAPITDIIIHGSK